MRNRGARLIERIEQGLGLANVVNGELQGLSVAPHIRTEAPRGSGAGIDDTIHIAHLCKSLAKPVEILLGHKMTIINGAVEVDEDDAKIIGKDDSATEEGGGGIAADAERVGGKNAVPCGR